MSQQLGLFDAPAQRHSQTSVNAAIAITPSVNRLQARVLKPKRDLTGQRFGWLVALRAERKDGRLEWRCQCDCGETSVVDCTRLLKGITKSCGCQRLVFSPERIKAMGDRARTHGCRKTRTYKCWQSMKERCLCDGRRDYLTYKGAGVTICERWLNSFENFLADMGHAPDGQSLDRFPDTRGNYEPGNCRWATATQQQRNKTDNLLLTAFGETKCAAEWLEDERCQANWTALYKRVEIGWDHERAITQPMKKMSNRTQGPGGCQKSKVMKREAALCVLS